MEEVERRLYFRFRAAAAGIFAFGFILNILVFRLINRVGTPRFRVGTALKQTLIACVLFSLIGSAYSIVKVVQFQPPKYEPKDSELLISKSAPCIVLLSLELVFRLGVQSSLAVVSLSIMLLHHRPSLSASHISHCKFAAFGLDCFFTVLFLWNQSEEMFHLHHLCTYETMALTLSVFPFAQMLSLCLSLVFLLCAACFRIVPALNRARNRKLDEGRYSRLKMGKERLLKQILASALLVLIVGANSLPLIAWNTQLVRFWLAAESICPALLTLLLPSLAFCVCERLNELDSKL